MTRTKGKTGSKVKVPCPQCGKVVTKAGLVGHMAWKHGKDSRRPMLPSTAMPRLEEKRKAKLFDTFVETMNTLAKDGKLDEFALFYEAVTICHELEQPGRFTDLFNFCAKRYGLKPLKPLTQTEGYTEAEHKPMMP